MRKRRHCKSNEESPPRPRIPQLAIASGSENPSISPAKRATRSKSKSIESTDNMLSPSLLEESPKKRRKSDSKDSSGGRSTRRGVPLCKRVRRKSEAATSNASSSKLADGSQTTPTSPTSTVTANEQTTTYTFSTSTKICNLPNAVDFMKINVDYHLRGVDSKCECNAPSGAVLSSMEDYVKHCIQYHQPSVVISHSELTQYSSPGKSSTKEPSKYSSVLRMNCLLDSCNVPENVDASVIRLKEKSSIAIPDDPGEPPENPSGEEYSPPFQQTSSFDEDDHLMFDIPSPSPSPHFPVCCASNDQVDDDATEVQSWESLKDLPSTSPLKRTTFMQDDKEIDVIDLTGVDEVLLHQVCDNFSFTIPTMDKKNVEQKLKEQISDYEEAYQILESNSDKLTKHPVVHLDYLDSDVFFDALARYHIKNFEYLERQGVSSVPSTPKKVKATTLLKRGRPLKKKHLSENKGKPLKANLSAYPSALPKRAKRPSDSVTRAERAKRRRTLGPSWSIPYVHDPNIPVTILENIWHLPKTAKSLHNLEENHFISPSSQRNPIVPTSQETTTVVVEPGKETQAEKNIESTFYGGPPSILSNPFTIDDWEGLSEEEDFFAIASALTPRILHNMGTKMAMVDILEDGDSP